ncbi:FAS1 domain-containing protein [Wilcoxina mikolae CBS 423.85]|nr:FAS1 domain-containing protein [Wilcoxina mikolae CBS 423.85]
MNPLTIIPFVLYISTVLSQPLMVATQNRVDLSRFRQLVLNNPGPSRVLITQTQDPPSQQRTLLIPNNAAFAAYEAKYGRPVESTPQTILSALLAYHTLNGPLTDIQLSQPGGLSAPSSLIDTTYNQRIPALQMPGPKDGQVVLLTQVAGLGRFSKRGQMNPLYAQSGLGDQVGVETTGYDWDGGRWHVVDGFLTLPITCSRTMAAVNLSRLLASLNRASLIRELDTAVNVTYLAPYDKAFSGINSSYPLDDLRNDLRFHILNGSQYSTELKDGQTFTSLQGGEVKVTKTGGDLYFNGVKAVAQDVITNNGVMHVLSKMMEQLNSTNSTDHTIEGKNSTPTTGPVPTFTASGTRSVVDGMLVAAVVAVGVWVGLV